MSDKPKGYKLPYSAAELQRLVELIQQKLDQSAIITSHEGASDENILSAEYVNDRFGSLENSLTGTGLRDAINALDNSNIFTDAHLQAVESTSLRFIGTFATITARNNIDTTDFAGGEVILLLSNESGNVGFQYYDLANTNWISTDKLSINSEVNVPAVGASVLKTFPQADFKLMDLTVLAKSGSGFHRSVVSIGWHGADVYITSTGDLFNVEHFEVDAAIITATNTVEISVTTLIADTDIQAEITAAY